MSWIFRSAERAARKFTKSNCRSMFTLPTRTRQNCLVLSCPRRRCEHNCRQDKTVLSRLQLCNLRQNEVKGYEYDQTSRYDEICGDIHTNSSPLESHRRKLSLRLLGSSRPVIKLLGFPAFEPPHFRYARPTDITADLKMRMSCSLFTVPYITKL